jgi:type IV secretory pathway VirB10-like protein
MTSSARIFFAEVGTTFVILAVGFGGGLFMANSALKEPTGYQAKAKTEPSSPVRGILPTSAEAVQPAQPPRPAAEQVAAVEPASAPSSEPVQAAPPEKRVEKADTKKAEMEVREGRKRYAERKAWREASRVRQQLAPRVREDARVLAFGSDEPQRGFGFFGNN